MSLFNLKGKKPVPVCLCKKAPENKTAADGTARAAGNGCIKVLGAGCKSCRQQYENVKKAIEAAGLNVQAEYITDMPLVMQYGVMSMPAIVINETVAASGRVLKPSEVKQLLKEAGLLG